MPGMGVTKSFILSYWEAQKICSCRVSTLALLSSRACHFFFLLLHPYSICYQIHQCCPWIQSHNISGLTEKLLDLSAVSYSTPSPENTMQGHHRDLAQSQREIFILNDISSQTTTDVGMSNRAPALSQDTDLCKEILEGVCADRRGTE